MSNLLLAAAVVMLFAAGGAVVMRRCGRAQFPDRRIYLVFAVAAVCLALVYVMG